MNHRRVWITGFISRFELIEFLCSDRRWKRADEKIGTTSNQVIQRCSSHVAAARQVQREERMAAARDDGDAGIRDSRAFELEDLKKRCAAGNRFACRIANSFIPRQVQLKELSLPTNDRTGSGIGDGTLSQVDHLKVLTGGSDGDEVILCDWCFMCFEDSQLVGPARDRDHRWNVRGFFRLVP